MLTLATSWKPRAVEGGYAIQLFDADGQPIDGPARWEGDFHCSYNRLTSLAGAPQEVGGGFYCGYNRLTSLEGAPTGYSAGVSARIEAARRARGMTGADGVLAHIMRQLGNAALIRRVGQQTTEWLVTDGEYYAHGATPEEAKADLIYKRSSHDTSQFRKWTLDSEVELAEAILAYRSITGACAAGVRGFCGGRQLPEKVKVRDVIAATGGQFGNKQFAEFFGGDVRIA